MNHSTKQISNFFTETDSLYKRRNISLDNSMVKLFLNILNVLPEGIWIYDADGKVLMVNHAAELLEGLKAEEMVGKTYREIYEEGIFDRMTAPEVFKSKKEVSLLSYTRRTKKQLLITGIPIFDEKGDIQLVVNSIRDVTELTKIQEKLKETQEVTRKIQDELTELNLLELKNQEIIAESDSMKQVLTVAVKLASIDVAIILVLGESGVGKGLISKFIHNNSKRNKNPFIQLNCAAFPENLLEAELFGYEPGAFTGASKDGKIGLLELADQGTLFLDEIGDLPLSLQAKLLNFLEDFEVRRLGGVNTKKVNCTIIAATNHNLKEMMKKKKFRRDLYYRLEVFTIQIPPLRDRSEDIYKLVSYFLKKFNKTYEKNCRISNEIMMKLSGTYLSGNVRQLRNVLNMAVAMSDKNNIDELVLQKVEPPPPNTVISISNESRGKSLKDMMFETEQKILKEAKKKHKSVRMIAVYLKLSKSSVARKLKEHGIK